MLWLVITICVHTSPPPSSCCLSHCPDGPIHGCKVSFVVFLEKHEKHMPSLCPHLPNVDENSSPSTTLHFVQF